MFLLVQVNCTNPTPDNGQIIPSEPSYSVNTTVSFTCPSAYILDGSNTSTCQPSLSWNPQPPLCVNGNKSCSLFATP